MFNCEQNVAEERKMIGKSSIQCAEETLNEMVPTQPQNTNVQTKIKEEGEVTWIYNANIGK